MELIAKYKVGRHDYRIPTELREKTYEMLIDEGWDYCYDHPEEHETWVTGNHSYPLEIYMDEEKAEIIKTSINDEREQRGLPIIDKNYIVGSNEDCAYWTDSDDDDNDNFINLHFVE